MVTNWFSSPQRYEYIQDNQNTKMWYLWLLTIEICFYYLILQYLLRLHIQNVYCCITCLCPKTNGQIYIMAHCLGSLYNELILHVYNHILMCFVRHCQIPLDLYFPTKSVKLFGGIYSSIIWSQHFNLLTCLIFLQKL